MESLEKQLAQARLAVDSFEEQLARAVESSERVKQKAAKLASSCRGLVRATEDAEDDDDEKDKEEVADGDDAEWELLNFKVVETGA